MANRRMFSLDVVDTDKFLELPATSQSLYFHLGMRADDDGFVSSPKKIASMVNCSSDDLKLLIAKNYLIPFEDGVMVITEWKINNWIRPDRKQNTRFINELSMLHLEDDTYKLTNQCQPNDNQVTTECHTEVRLGKVRLNKYSYQDSDLDIAKKLQLLILEVNPGNRCKNANLEKWANDIRLIQEKDERSNKEIDSMIDYIFNKDDFWKIQIQSPGNLRKHWDKIYPKIDQDTNKLSANTKKDEYDPYKNFKRL